MKDCGLSLFYNLIYQILRFGLLLLAPLLSEKTKRWIELRNNTDIFSQKFESKSLRLWIHASSGEIEYAKGFIREFKRQNPDAQIFVSYSSLSAPNLFKNIQTEVTAFFPLNWDTTKDNQKLLEFIRPNVLIFSRTDFWLNLIACAHKKSIPLAAIATNPQNIFWLKKVCRDFRFLSCVQPDQAQLIKMALPAVEVQCIPDTRFDQVFFRLAQKSQIDLPPSKYVTFGSTWPKDETVLKIATTSLLAKGYSLIWAPHEMSHAQSLKSDLQNLFPDKKIIFSSTYKTDKFDILIIDRIGILADAYRSSKISFVGGSFVQKVHSVMEPLCANNMVIVGPYYQNNPEALEFKKMKFVQSVENAEGFLEAFAFFEKNENLYPALKKQTELKQGGSEKTVSALIRLLKTVKS